MVHRTIFVGLTVLALAGISTHAQQQAQQQAPPPGTPTFRSTTRLIVQTLLGVTVVGLWLVLGNMLLDVFDWGESIKTAVGFLLFFELGVLSRYVVGWVMPDRNASRTRS